MRGGIPSPGTVPQRGPPCGLVASGDASLGSRPRSREGVNPQKCQPIEITQLTADRGATLETVSPWVLASLSGPNYITKPLFLTLWHRHFFFSQNSVSYYISSTHAVWKFLTVQSKFTGNILGACKSINFQKLSKKFPTFSPLAPSSESTLIGPRMVMISLRLSQSTLRLWMYCRVVHFILSQSHWASRNWAPCRSQRRYLQKLFTSKKIEIVSPPKLWVTRGEFSSKPNQVITVVRPAT